MKILVTGGTGFIGGALAKRLLRDGHDVLVTGTQSERVPAGSKLLPLHIDGIDWAALKGVEIIFHQAAINDTTFRDTRQMMLANFEGPRTLFNRALDLGCRRFVFASSTAIYGGEEAPYVEGKTKIKPLNPYGESKAAFEDFAFSFARRTGAKVVGLRYCNVYGPGEGHKGHRMSMVGQLIRQVMRSGRCRLFKNGEQKRDWLYVEDAVDANLAAMVADTGVFNCGSGTSTSFNDVGKLICEELKLPFVVDYVDNPYSQQYQSHTECDMERSKHGLQFEPRYTLKAGIMAYIQSITAGLER